MRAGPYQHGMGWKSLESSPVTPNWVRMGLIVTLAGLAFAMAASVGCSGYGGRRGGGDPGPVDGLDGGASSADGGVTPDGDGGPGLPAVEQCDNGLDDDQDGLVDEDCGCVRDTTQACFLGPVGIAGVGACAMGAQNCEPTGGEFSAWGDCTGSVAPEDETCNGVDDDCDGSADEGCSCVIDEMVSCYEGPAGTADVGECRAGMQRCVDREGLGKWGDCGGAVLPVDEICADGLDNDCDGETDEDCVCAPGESRRCPGGSREGICRPGTQTCEAGGEGGSRWGECSGRVDPSPERCDNGVDDDCNGIIDDGCRPTSRCIEVPEGERRDVTLRYRYELVAADVLLLVDETGSMGSIISSLESQILTDILPGLRAEITDLEVAVAGFRDFPVGSYGDSGDTPFSLYQQATSSSATVDSAVSALYARGGNDTPESQVEALYQVATGAGIGPWVAAQSCPGERLGYACFRREATPIVLLFTDAPFHNGPTGTNTYSGVSPTPHTYRQAADALAAIGGRVMGFDAGSGGADADLRQIAIDSGAVRSDGTPLVFDVSSTTRLGAEVVDAVRTMASDSPMDIDLVVEEVTGSGGAALVASIAAVSASPASGATRRADRFDHVHPGTEVTFVVTLDNRSFPSSGPGREFVLRLVLRGDGVTRLLEEEVRVVVPGSTGAGC